MSAILDNPGAILPTRYAWLMGLYGENYYRLMRQFAPKALGIGSYLSSLEDQLDLRFDVMECNRYTQDVRMTYCFVDDETGCLAPSAHVRLYHDAHVAEVIHCEGRRQFEQIIGAADPPPREVFNHRLRLSLFLSRWLEYLIGQGHSSRTLMASADVSAGPVD